MKFLPLHLIWILMIIADISDSHAQHARTGHWLDRNRQFISEIDTAARGGVIFLGNSITEGFDLVRCFPGTRPINRGISGDHIDGLLERLETSAVQLKPRRLFLLIGINDIGAGDPDSTIIANYHRLLMRIGSELPETSVHVHSILPTTTAWPNCPKEKIVRLNGQIREMALGSGCDWIDLYPLFEDGDGYLRRELTSDGLHLNDAGYRLWSGVLKQAGLE